MQPMCLCKELLESANNYTNNNNSRMSNNVWLLYVNRLHLHYNRHPSKRNTVVECDRRKSLPFTLGGVSPYRPNEETAPAAVGVLTANPKK